MVTAQLEREPPVTWSQLIFIDNLLNVCIHMKKRTIRLGDKSNQTVLMIPCYTISMPCPVYKRPIEKNDGCMRMTCSRPCSHEFPRPATAAAYTSTTTRSTTRKRRPRETRPGPVPAVLHYHERWATNLRSGKESRGRPQAAVRRPRPRRVEQCAGRAGDAAGGVKPRAWQAAQSMAANIFLSIATYRHLASSSKTLVPIVQDDLW